VSLRFLQYVRIIVHREDFLPSPMNLARQKTCKLLMQVHQKFVIHWALQAANALPTRVPSAFVHFGATRKILCALCVLCG
jgi:hypothetical protein